MRVQLDQVEALEAIATTGSFAAAARHLHKTQSAISYAIKQLENALGIALFDRSGHKAVLTPEGVAVLDEGRFLLSRARRIAWLADRFNDAWEARLQVVMDGVLPMRPIMAVLKQLDEEGIPTHIQVTMEYLTGVQARFEADEADLMAVWRYTPQPWLQARPLPPEQLVLVAHRDHPVHDTPRPHDLVSLQRHLELSVHDSSQLTRGRDTHSTEGARVFYVTDFHTKRQGLRMGLGFGWIPEELVAEDLAEGTLALVPAAAGHRRVVQPHLVYRTDRPLGRAGRRLVAELTGADVEV